MGCGQTREGAQWYLHVLYRRGLYSMYVSRGNGKEISTTVIMAFVAYYSALPGIP